MVGLRKHKHQLLCGRTLSFSMALPKFSVPKYAHYNPLIRLKIYPLHMVIVAFLLLADRVSWVQFVYVILLAVKFHS